MSDNSNHGEEETSHLLPTTKATNPQNNNESVPPIDLYDKNRLRKLKLRSIENLAIPIFYFMLGFGQKLPFVASRQYLRRVLKLSPANQGLILDVIVQIPWSLKLLYAFLSDTYPLCGKKRKPYLFIGIICCGLSWILLGSIRPPPKTTLTCVLMFLATFGLLMADVMADALVVEKVSLERNYKNISVSI
jgi:hypothetical protein